MITSLTLRLVMSLMLGALTMSCWSREFLVLFGISFAQLVWLYIAFLCLGSYHFHGWCQLPVGVLCKSEARPSLGLGRAVQ